MEEILLNIRIKMDIHAGSGTQDDLPLLG